jgi:hypothetical protein
MPTSRADRLCDSAKDARNKPPQIGLVRYCTAYVSSARYLVASVLRAPADEIKSIHSPEGVLKDADLRHLKPGTFQIEDALAIE